SVKRSELQPGDRRQENTNWILPPVPKSKANFLRWSQTHCAYDWPSAQAKRQDSRSLSAPKLLLPAPGRSGSEYRLSVWSRRSCVNSTLKLNPEGLPSTSIHGLSHAG